MYVYTYVYIYIYGFLVCRYARSLGLAARQNTPAIDGAIYRPNGYIISTPVQFSSTIDGTGADGPRSEGGKRILLDNSQVYVRFLPFVGGRVHAARLDIRPA